MKTHVDKTQKNTMSPTRQEGSSTTQKSNGQLIQFVDNRPETILQRRLIQMVNKSSKGQMTLQKKAALGEEEILQGKFEAIQKQEIDEEELLQGKFKTIQGKVLEEEELLRGKFEGIQKQGIEEEELQMKAAPIQKKSATDSPQAEAPSREPVRKNNTGLPDNLKSGIENLSGMSLDDVKVHRNSDKPAQLQAHAYAQGTDIHLGPGQEKHLPHEAWHVVQQKQGRVKPTLQMKVGVNVNDDAGLEKEADVMGTKALNHEAINSGQLGEKAIQKPALLKYSSNNPAWVIQPKLLFNGRWYGNGEQGDLSNLRLDNGRHLPGWNSNQLQSDTRFYILNENFTEWVEDQKIYINRTPTKNNPENKRKDVRTGVHGPEINNTQDGHRVTPKQTTRKMVSKAILIKNILGKEAKECHWELECEVEGGKIKKTIFMDLNKPEHRIYYGATKNVSKKKEAQEYDRNEFEAIPFTLKRRMPVHDVYRAMLEVAKEDGGWTDTIIGYNCQDFVLSMLKKLDIVETETLENQASWREDQKETTEIEHEWVRMKTILI